MTTYKVTFTSNNADNAFTLFESNELEKAENFFEAQNFDNPSFDLVDEEDNHSEIELQKFIDDEIQDFSKGESRLSENGGWIIKKYYAA